MKISCYLIIDSNQKIRVTKNQPGLYMSEIAVHLDIDVPNAVFKRPIPTLGLDIPADIVSNPDAEVVARLTAFEIADKLKLDVKTVTDGLVEMIKERDAKNATA